MRALLTDPAVIGKQLFCYYLFKFISMLNTTPPPTTSLFGDLSITDESVATPVARTDGSEFQVRDDVVCHSHTGQANHSNLEEVGHGAELASRSKLEWLQYESIALNDEKAARNDDAVIQTEQWDLYLLRSLNPDYQLSMIGGYTELQEQWNLKRNQKPLICSVLIPTSAHTHLFKVLRKASSTRFARNVYLSFKNYMYHKYGKDRYQIGISLFHSSYGNRRRNELKKLFEEDEHLLDEFIKKLPVGREAVERACGSSFWDWDKGSSLFFWRWPTKFQKEARDGTPIHVTGNLPRYRVAQKWPRDEEVKEKMIDKWMKVIDREYIKHGPAISLTGSFPVPKGDSDIRMVYDASKCGLNDQIWALT